MSVVLSFLPVAACGLAMWICMRAMHRPAGKTTDAASVQEVATLRTEVQQLRAELNVKEQATSADENA